MGAVQPAELLSAVSLLLHTSFDLFIAADKTELVMVRCPRGSLSVRDLIFPHHSPVVCSVLLLHSIVGGSEQLSFLPSHWSMIHAHRPTKTVYMVLLKRS